MQHMAETFAEYFRPWGITLPAGQLAARQPGQIDAQGWSIRYRFGADDRGEYLDFYATHRMTNDRHMRIRAAGEMEHLIAPQEFIVYGPEATPEEKRQAEEAYYAHNRQAYAELRRKGLLPPA